MALLKSLERTQCGVIICTHQCLKREPVTVQKLINSPGSCIPAEIPRHYQVRIRPDTMFKKNLTENLKPLLGFLISLRPPHKSDLFAVMILDQMRDKLPHP